ncbi:uncharacterized protein [Typha angustifolia]|uniref:uncharacterized protein n=1 Tax=Typha angustifolia TaxID=59011 RepID=UPI003C308673
MSTERHLPHTSEIRSGLLRPNCSRVLGDLFRFLPLRSRSVTSPPSSMAIPSPYSGVSTLAFVARASAFTFGLVYGSMKLSYLKTKAKSHKKADAKGHH